MRRIKETTEPVVPALIRRLLIGWLVAILIGTLRLTREFRDLSDLDGLAERSLLLTLLISSWTTLLLETTAWFRTAVLRSPGRGGQNIERWILLLLFAADAALALTASFTWPFAFACLLIGFGLTVYVLIGWRSDPPKHLCPLAEKPIWLWLTAGLSFAFLIFDSVWTVSRVESFSTPTYDFGIFSQMFYNIRKTGLLMTTLERDGLLSHFRVHFSPIWYLMLPFYWLFPTPATLQVLQAAVVVSSVIPLWKLCKAHNHPAPIRFLLCALLLFYPSFSGGTSYDVHENCFLTPLLLWLFYAIDQKRVWPAAAVGLLVLTVKEDAATYAAVIGLWLSLRSLLHRTEDSRGMLRLGIGLFTASLLWFLLVTVWLTRAGDGVMTDRYKIFMYDGTDSLLAVVKAVFLQPFKAVYESIKQEKLEYIALSLVPLLGLPLWTRRFERMLLLIPFVLVNLMTDYKYQHNIFYQYSFGSTAFLFYLTVVNLEDWRPRWARTALPWAAAALCAVCFCCTVVPEASRYIQNCAVYSDYYDQIREQLSVIPKDASVSAATFLTTELSQRELLYDVAYGSFEHLLETEYVVLSASDTFSCRKYASPKGDDGLERLIARLETAGYEGLTAPGSPVLIYHRHK